MCDQAKLYCFIPFQCIMTACHTNSFGVTRGSPSARETALDEIAKSRFQEEISKFGRYIKTVPCLYRCSSRKCIPVTRLSSCHGNLLVTSKPPLPPTVATKLEIESEYNRVSNERPHYNRHYRYQWERLPRAEWFDHLGSTLSANGELHYEIA